MNIYITGASGFIGGAIARDLACDHTVHAMSRSAKSDDVVKALGARPVRGDLESISPRDLPDIDAVVHCAAWVEPWGTREDFWKANVDGTDRVLAATRAAGANRFIHISTEAVLWHGQHMRGVDETEPYPARTPYLYSETKAEAERHVLAANEKHFDTIALRPRFVWGPGLAIFDPEASAGNLGILCHDDHGARAHVLFLRDQVGDATVSVVR